MPAWQPSKLYQLYGPAGALEVHAPAWHGALLVAVLSIQWTVADYFEGAAAGKAYVAI